MATEQASRHPVTSLARKHGVTIQDGIVATESERNKVKPTIQNQGIIIVEPDEDGFLVMFPNGDIVLASTKVEVERKAAGWFKKHATADIAVGRTEWRL